MNPSSTQRFSQGFGAKLIIATMVHAGPQLLRFSPQAKTALKGFGNHSVFWSFGILGGYLGLQPLGHKSGWVQEGQIWRRRVRHPRSCRNQKTFLGRVCVRFAQATKTGEFQVTVCGVTVVHSRDIRELRGPNALKKGSNAPVTKLPFQ